MANYKKIMGEISRPDPGYEMTAGIKSLTGKPPRFVSEGQTGKRILIQLFVNVKSRQTRAKIFLGKDCEGPPNHAHGGCTAAVLDEVMGQSAWLKGYFAVAARIEIDLLRPVPLNQILFSEGKIISVVGKKVMVRADLKSKNGEILAKSKGLFIVLPKSSLANFGR